MSEPKRWMLEWDEDKGCSCGQKEHPEGDFVYYSAYAEIKAELRRKAIDSISDIGQLGEQSAEIAHLKAEVERLTAFTTRTIIPNEILQAQVERLEFAIITGNAINPDAKPE
jgi:hypothetical protein